MFFINHHVEFPKAVSIQYVPTYRNPPTHTHTHIHTHTHTHKHSLQHTHP